MVRILKLEIYQRRTKYGNKNKYTNTSNPRTKQKIQEICFKEGVYWRGGVSKTVQHLDMPYLHISNDHGEKYLTYSNLSISLVFSGNKIEEIDAGLFISTNGTCSVPTSKKIYKG